MYVLPERELRQVGSVNAIFSLAQVFLGISAGVWVTAVVTLRTVPTLSAENRAVFLVTEYGAALLAIFFFVVTVVGVYNSWRTVAQIKKEHKTFVRWETHLRETPGVSIPPSPSVSGAVIPQPTGGTGGSPS